jgi:hypothetical protein
VGQMGRKGGMQVGIPGRLMFRMRKKSKFTFRKYINILSMTYT